MSSSSEEKEEVYNVETILDRKLKGRKYYYYIKWENYSTDDNTWEPVENLSSCMQIVHILYIKYFLSIYNYVVIYRCFPMRNNEIN